MESREAALQALEEGNKLTSDITGLQYTLINGILHTRHSERKNWEPSGLTFESPPSWLNLRINPASVLPRTDHRSLQQ